MVAKKKLGILIGGFRLGPHNSHIEIIREAASKVEMLMILIGSANQRISPKNPLGYHEINDMLVKSLWEAHIQNFTTEPINDYRYNDDIWCDALRKTVKSRNVPDNETVLFGHHKDATSFYLDLFPEWKQVELTSTNPELSSTDIRRLWMECNQVFTFKMEKLVPYHVKNHLLRREYDDDLQSEYNYYKKEAVTFAGYPYQETLNFNCADVVLECAGHILLGKRKNAPGRNCWALFGGFKNRNETFFECALRELMEESNVRLPERVLRKSVVNAKMFDDPSRSQGITRNTYAYHIKVDLNPDGTLPRANGSDDMQDELRWFPTDEAVNNLVLFDDHKDIISYFTGIYQTPAFLTM